MGKMGLIPHPSTELPFFLLNCKSVITMCGVPYKGQNNNHANTTMYILGHSALVIEMPSVNLKFFFGIVYLIKKMLRMNSCNHVCSLSC